MATRGELEVFTFVQMSWEKEIYKQVFCHCFEEHSFYYSSTDVGSNLHVHVRNIKLLTFASLDKSPGPHL